MLNYLIRRTLIGLITLFLITFLVYGLIRAMPGSPVEVQQALMDPSREPSEEDIEEMKKNYGLDQHWTLAYFSWLGKVAMLDLGNSFVEHKPVTQVIAPRIGPTLLLSISSLSLAYLLSIPMGLWSTAYGGTLRERSLSIVLYMFYSLPSYVAALFLQLLFAQWLMGTSLELPPTDMTSNDFEKLSLLGQTWDIFKHMILPATCYTYGSLAYYSRFIKANMNEVVRQDYIRTARAKGVGPFRVIVHHAFRNTLIPFVTLMGLTLPALLSGSIILEKIFNWPGMGQLFYSSILTRDYPVIMALTFMFTVLTLLGQLLADLLYAVVDPRITYS